jgi:type IV pilus assembly protein PilF
MRYDRFRKLGIAISILAILTGCAGKKMSKTDKARLYYDAGIGYINKGDPQNAIDNLKQANELDERNPLTLHAMGLAYFQLGIADIALVWLQKAAAISPDDPELNNNLASVYLTSGLFDKAIIHSTKAISNLDYRTPAAAYFNRGVSKSRLGDLNGAEADFRSAIRLEPLYDMPRVELGRIMYNRNQFNDAVTMLTSAIRANQNNPESFLLRGQAYWQQGYISKAESDFNTVLKMKNVTSSVREQAHDWLERIR